MLASSVKEFGKSAWLEVYNRIIGAVVFLDDASAECLHWDGGLFNLLTAGAVAVKSLSPFEFCRPEHKKALFITQATSTQLQTVKEIIRNSDFTHCILASSVSLDTIFLELNEGRDVSDVMIAGKALDEAAKQLERMLLEWIDKKQSAVEVLHIPIFTISLSSILFLTPQHNKVYPLYNGKLIPDTPSVDLYSLANEERAEVRRLASTLNSMFEEMNLKEDIYYMGTYSSIVAGVLENSPVCVGRRKRCTSPASLILVDRTLDLCGVASHSMEAVIDKVMSVLPRFPGHSTDVAVDMSPLCEANVISVAEDMQLSPGCLYHAEESCVQTFEHMIHKSQKEVMADLYNKLSKLDVPRSPGPRTLLKVTTQSVEKVVAASKGNYEVIERHLGLLQQALAVVQTLKSPRHAQHELLATLERHALESIATSRESTSVLSQISQLIASRKDRNLPLEALLALLVHVYSIAGRCVAFNTQHEAALQQTLGVALFEDHVTLFPDGGHVVSPEQCAGIAEDIVRRLRDVARLRQILQRYNSVIKPTETGVGHEYRGLLQQLVEDLVDSRRPEMPDLRHRNEGLKDLLRSGLNILTSKKSRSTKHPMDSPTVIIYVIGGVTGEESARLHRSVITSGLDSAVVLGSTRLVAPAEAMRQALGLELSSKVNVGFVR